ncbi:MAG: MFS transporter [Actinomycetota bacterium]|nr:MFS transporter [Actinomycetota bacterium]
MLSRPSHPPLWSIFLVTASGIMANTLVSPVVPDVLDAFDRPDSDAGILIACGPAPAILLAPFTGLLADRWGRRQVLVPSLVLFGVGGTAAALAPTFWALVAARLVQGCGGASLIGLSVVLISDHWSGADRTRYIGWNSAVLTTCIAALPAVGGGLSELGSWRYAFAPYPLTLITAATMWRMLTPVERDDPTPVAEQFRAALRGVRHPIVLASNLYGFALFILIFGLFLTAFPLHLEDDFGLSAGQRGLVIAVPALSATTAALSLPRLRARWGARRIVLFGTCVLAGAYLVVGISPTILLVLAAALAYGFAEGSMVPTMQDLVASNAPDESRAAVVSFYVSVVRAGQTIGPLLTGVALGIVGTSTVFAVGSAVLVLMALAQVVIRIDRRTPTVAPTA